MLNFLKNVLSSVLLFQSCCLFGQIDNSVFYSNNKEINPADSGKLLFRTENTNFFKNNEYFNKIVVGYTEIGYLLKPELVYSPTSRIRISGGVQLLKYSGINKFSDVLPVFSFQYKLLPQLDVVMGSIYGGLNHKLIEPVYQFENSYNHPVENGVQFLYKSSRIESDIWLEWERFIFQGSPYQEQLCQGTSSKIWLNDKDKKLTVSIPIQTIITHHGGQINANKDQPLQTIANLGSALSLDWNRPESFIKKINFQGWLIDYHDLSPNKQQKFNSGFGLYPCLNLESQCFKMMCAYWAGNKFFSLKGEPMFRSVSTVDSMYTEKNRQLLNFKLAYEKYIAKGIALSLRFESYYGMKDHNFDYSYGLHLIFNRDFFITRLKQD
ncbi:MAG: hypothetical protein Q8910_05615 [Bacteroidota bacterium]|nr:hypothetical protein [Bacteroidota bacterium]